MSDKQGNRQELVAPRWQTVVLVCGRCRRRNDGDVDLKTREVMRTMSRGLGTRSVRVVKSSCLGLCPKRAIAIGLAGEAPARAAIVRNDDDVERAVQDLKRAIR